MNWLLDGNVLVAMFLSEHPHHRRVHLWLASTTRDKIFTCSTTEGTLLRMHMQFAKDSSAQAAWSALEKLRLHPRHKFLTDQFSYTEFSPAKIHGHRQVPDAWLVHLAKRNKAKLATLDAALSSLYPQDSLLIPL